MSRFLPAFALSAILLANNPTLALAPIGKPDPAKVELPVPAKAMVVAQVQGVERTRGRLLKLVQAADPKSAEQVGKRFDQFVTDQLAGRDLKGLDPNGRIFLAIHSFDNFNSPEESEVAVLFPSTDYKGFREKLLTAAERKEFRPGKRAVDRIELDGETTYLIDLTAKGYVVVTKHADTADLYAGKYVALAPKDMGEAVAEAFLGADVSLFVNMDRILDEYGDKIKQFRGLFQLLLQQGGAGAIPGLDQKQLELVKLLYEGLFQGIEDSKGLALGFSFQPEGLALRIETAFAPDTKTSKALGAEKPGKIEMLSELPAGRLSYTAGMLSKKMMSSFASLGSEFAPEDGNDKSAKLVEAYREALSNASVNGFAELTGGNNSGLAVLAPNDPDTLVTAKLAALKSLTSGGTYRNVVLKEKPVVKEATQKLAGYTLHEARFVLDFEATVQNVGDQNVREAMLAGLKRSVPEKPTVWFGTDGKKVVQISAKDWDAAKKLLDDLTSGKSAVGNNESFKTTRSQLPGEVSVIAIFDLAEAMVALSEQAGDMTANLPGLPVGEIPKLKKPDGPPVYVGVSVVVKSNGFRIDAFVPAKSVDLGKTILAPLFEKKDD